MVDECGERVDNHESGVRREARLSRRTEKCDKVGQSRTREMNQLLARIGSHPVVLVGLLCGAEIRDALLAEGMEAIYHVPINVLPSSCRNEEVLTDPDDTLAITHHIRSELNPAEPSATNPSATRTLVSPTHPRVVLPTPGGPQTSVTWPLIRPPFSTASSEWLRRFPATARSSSGRPVATWTEATSSSSSSASAAETVGSRSESRVEGQPACLERSNDLLDCVGACQHPTYASTASRSCRRRGRVLRDSPCNAEYLLDAFRHRLSECSQSP